MREEAERVVQAEGRTKSAIANMPKIDSFLRESQRMNSANPSAHDTSAMRRLLLLVIFLTRKVVAEKGFTFSDGTVIPYGSFLSVAMREVGFKPGEWIHLLLAAGFSTSTDTSHPLIFKLT
jgi:hypothetical protein